MQVIKRDGSIEAFDINKIIATISKAFPERIIPYPKIAIKGAINRYLPNTENIDVESIQDCIEHCLHSCFPYEVAKSYMLYRAQREESRFIREILDYIDKYTEPTEKSTSSKEATASDNSTIKNKSTKSTKSTKYLDIAVKLLIELCKDDVPKISAILYAQSGKDYKTIYTYLKSIKDEIESIEYKLKQEGNI